VPSSDALGAGDALGPYEIEAALGEGGMGQVFRARNRDSGELVALKVVKPGLVGDEQSARRFLHEARAAQEVQHRHLVGVVDAGESDGRRYLAMRYVAGRSLDACIAADGPLSIEETVRVATHVAAGLDALHDAGIVHRDVKASNILLDEDGSASLTDFGLAKGNDYSAVTKLGQAVGTIDYLAPELIRGDVPTPASDLYSLGCVAFECLTARTPFGGRGLLRVGMGHLDEPPADPCAERPEAPPELGFAVNTALAKDPAQRPPSATAYARMLALAAGMRSG
jgi:serine/threonine protein kinase